MIVKDDRAYYPIGFGEIRMDGKSYYERSMREEPWFYLALETGNRENNSEHQNSGE